LRAFCLTPGFESTKETFTLAPRIAERPPSFLDRIRRRLRA
ncbi:MAG: hypothetical protein QOH21_3204, partial [Acidobacteriota bacterium]|nr:hypothetical protein [Acidobacteriota bacterium]